MNDQPAPFSPFSPTPPPVDPAAQGTPTKKRGRKPSVKKEVKLAAVKEAPVPTRKRARKQGRTMIPIGVLPALAGLQELETSMLMSIIGNLQEVPKKSRAKIVAALGKVFC